MQFTAQLPICDIFLCECCGSEFESLTDIKVQISSIFFCDSLLMILRLNTKAHEIKCIADKALGPNYGNKQLENNDQEQVLICSPVFFSRQIYFFNFLLTFLGQVYAVL